MPKGEQLAQARHIHTDNLQVDDLRKVTFQPVDDDLVSSLPFSTLAYFDAAARNVTGLSNPSGAPTRAFELWGRTARTSATSVHVASCAVQVLERSVPSLLVRRPHAIAAPGSGTAASIADLTISSSDDQFAAELLRAPLTRLLQELPRGASFAVQGCFALLQVSADDPSGLRSLAERCEAFVEALPNAAIARFPLAATDPLAA